MIWLVNIHAKCAIRNPNSGEEGRHACEAFVLYFIVSIRRPWEVSRFLMDVLYLTHVRAFLQTVSVVLCSFGPRVYGTSGGHEEGNP